MTEPKRIPSEVPQERPHHTNPFLDGFRIKTRPQRKTLTSDRRKGVVDLDTGEIEETAELVKRVPTDTAPFIKVFSDQLYVVLGLSHAGVRLLTIAWIELSRDPGRHKVSLSERIAAQHANEAGGHLSRSLYFRGRKELIARGIIAETTEPNLYWINPQIFFNGNRLPLVKEAQSAA